jgi:hypothetical protein
VRVNEPVLAWGACVNVVGGDVITRYLFVLGIPCDNGETIYSGVGAWYLGDSRFPSDGTDLAFTGSRGAAYPDGTGGVQVTQYLGGSTQLLVEDDDTTMANALTYAGGTMLEIGVPNAEIPAYRGYLCAFLGHLTTGSGLNVTANPERISFEAWSYSADWVGSIGVDGNPAWVLLDLLKFTFGKIGVPVALIDTATFEAARLKLFSEQHGYSRLIVAGEADAHIQEILEQIDGVLRENPTTQKLELKLIRNDYLPGSIFHISKDNCSEIQNLAIGGWQGVPNKVRVVFTNRENAYRDGSAIAHNQANAVGQDGAVREVTIRMPGICNQVLADTVAARELAARSRPITKLRAICDRTARNLMPGDPVKLTWTDPDIAGLIFRIADVDRGTLADGKVAIDLISDNSYVWRNAAPQNVDLGNLGVDTRRLEW